jgi:hypothetical protein
MSAKSLWATHNIGVLGVVDWSPLDEANTGNTNARGRLRLAVAGPLLKEPD